LFFFSFVKFEKQGNYSEGFGKLKPQQEFDQKQGKVTGLFGSSPSGDGKKKAIFRLNSIFNV
jgi:hypothetical protein